MFFRWKYQEELKKQLQKYFEYQNAVFQNDVDDMDYTLNENNARKRPLQKDETVTKKPRLQQKQKQI